MTQLRRASPIRSHRFERIRFLRIKKELVATLMDPDLTKTTVVARTVVRGLCDSLRL